MELEGCDLSGSGRTIFISQFCLLRVLQTQKLLNKHLSREYVCEHAWVSVIKARPVTTTLLYEAEIARLSFLMKHRAQSSWKMYPYHDKCSKKCVSPNIKEKTYSPTELLEGAMHRRLKAHKVRWRMNHGPGKSKDFSLLWKTALQRPGKPSHGLSVSTGHYIVTSAKPPVTGPLLLPEKIQNRKLVDREFFFQKERTVNA